MQDAGQQRRNHQRRQEGGDLDRLQLEQTQRDANHDDPPAAVSSAVSS